MSVKVRLGGPRVKHYRADMPVNLSNLPEELQSAHGIAPMSSFLPEDDDPKDVLIRQLVTALNRVRKGERFVYMQEIIWQQINDALQAASEAGFDAAPMP